MAAAAVAAAALASAAAGGCGTTNAPASTPRSPTAPLDTVVAGPTGEWATLAMGHLDDPNNTFWQAFYLPAGGESWSLRTPPGVADNGGLVTAVNGSKVLIGVLPSNKLHFSPVAITTDDGASYTPGLLPAGLAAVPDAIAATEGGSAYALTAAGLLTSRGSLTDWRSILTLPAPSSATAGCSVAKVTAVAATATGPAIGAACTVPGRNGIFLLDGRSLRDMTPKVSTDPDGGVVGVLRLVSDGQGLAALLQTGGRPRPTFTAGWTLTAPGPWTLSAPSPAGSLLSSSVTATGTFAVLTRSADGALHASTVQPDQPTWTALPPPPASTVAIAVGPTRVDALAVNITDFTDYQLVGGRWVEHQIISVPIGFVPSS